MPEIRIYFEGDKALRSGFHRFFSGIYQAARAKRWELRLIATGGTPRDDFSVAINTHPDAINVLLLDSESRDDGRLTERILREQGWPREVESCVFWMVEMMESWFHADQESLSRFYRDGFNRSALSRNPRVEEIPKRDLEHGLKEATRHSQKGKYHKIHHAPELLACIDPALVQAAAPNCRKMFDDLLGLVYADQ